MSRPLGVASALLLASLLACGNEPVAPADALSNPTPTPVPAALPALSRAAVDPEVVTEGNLVEKSRYWPYRVALLERWNPGQGRPLVQANRVGVLIRVEPSGNPRIDFGGYGNYEIPVAKTDVVARANRIRLGQDVKQGPNFTHAIRTRMMSSEAEKPVMVLADSADARTGFLCVFADPTADGFPALAAALAPLRDRQGVGTIFFPQGEVSDAKVRGLLRELGWPVPFLPDFLSEPYTTTLLPELPDAPFVLLQTDEGRVVYQGALSAEASAELRTALERAFPDGSVQAQASALPSRP